MKQMKLEHAFHTNTHIESCTQHTHHASAVTHTHTHTHTHTQRTLCTDHHNTRVREYVTFAAVWRISHATFPSAPGDVMSALIATEKEALRP